MKTNTFDQIKETLKLCAEQAANDRVYTEATRAIQKMDCFRKAYDKIAEDKGQFKYLKKATLLDKFMKEEG